MSSRAAWGHFFALAIWIAIFSAIYVYLDAWQKPEIVVARADLTGGEVVIPRSRDGHYYVRGAINGYPVDFMVDTGASIVSISHDIAQRAGLGEGMQANFITASGTVMGKVIPGQTIEAGGIALQGLSIGVGIHGNIGLLGQNFLRKVDVLQSGDEMVLRIGS